MAGYLRDVDVSETWARLSENQNSLLIDVRTKAEWTFVGIPDLGSISKQPILQEWQSYPTMSIVEQFAALTAQAVEQSGGDKTTELYFLCRSGVRSQGAAAALTEAGFEKCFNVLGGFEGPPDGDGHRGHVDGWKAKGLPWRQN